jgi:hypothetical protein
MHHVECDVERRSGQHVGRAVPQQVEA